MKTFKQFIKEEKVTEGTSFHQGVHMLARAVGRAVFGGGRRRQQSTSDLEARYKQAKAEDKEKKMREYLANRDKAKVPAIKKDKNFEIDVNKKLRAKEVAREAKRRASNKEIGASPELKDYFHKKYGPGGTHEKQGNKFKKRIGLKKSDPNISTALKRYRDKKRQSHLTGG